MITETNMMFINLKNFNGLNKIVLNRLTKWKYLNKKNCVSKKGLSVNEILKIALPIAFSIYILFFVV